MQRLRCSTVVLAAVAWGSVTLNTDLLILRAQFLQRCEGLLYFHFSSLPRKKERKHATKCLKSPVKCLQSGSESHIQGRLAFWICLLGDLDNFDLQRSLQQCYSALTFEGLKSLWDFIYASELCNNHYFLNDFCFGNKTSFRFSSSHCSGTSEKFHQQ